MNWKKHRDLKRVKTWEARTWIDGKRKSRFFETRQERDIFIAENSTSDWIQIQEICRKFDLDPLEVVQKYIRENLQYESIIFSEAVGAFLKQKESLGASKDHLLHLNGFLKRFCDDFGSFEMNTVGLIDVEKFLRGQTDNPVTFRNYRKYLGVFYSWAFDMGYIKENLIKKIKNPKMVYNEPEFLKVEEARKLLEANRNERYAVQLALQMFAGLRASSCWQVTFDMINFEERSILLPAGIMKANRRHLLENLPANLWIWLEDAGPECFDWNFRNWKWEKEQAFKRAGVQSRVNVLRHSFATYLCALDLSAERCSYLMAHRNASMLYQHYKGCVSSLEAAKYFKLIP